MEGDAAERIRGQLLDINGYASGPRLTVAVTSVGPMHAPRVAYSAASHTYLVTWIERNGQQSVETYCLGTQCVTDYFYKNDLYVMPLAADGAPLAATPIRLTREVTEFGYSETAFDVVSNSQQNEFLVEWMQPRGAIFLMPNGNFVLQPNRVLAQRVSPDGTLLGGQVLMLIGTYHLYHTVYSPVSNEYLMTLDLWHGGSDGYEVYAQRYQADTLTARGGKADLSLRAAGDQTWTSVAYDPDLERYLVVWLDEAANPRRVRDILMKAGTGALLSAVGQVSNTTDGANIFYPFVAYSPVEQQYLVVMGTASGLEGRNVANSGAPVGTPAFAIGPVSFPGGVAARAGGDPNATHYVTVWERNGDIFSGSIPYVAPPTPTPTATPVVNPPVASKSIYVHSISADFKLYGCDEASNGPDDAFVILDFGQPWATTQNGQSVSEVKTWKRDELTIPQVEAAVHDYATSYWNCAAKGPIHKHVTLAVGLNNDSGNQNFVTAGHGQDWGKMINKLNTWARYKNCGITVPQPFGRICPLHNYVSIVAAMDIEMSGVAGRLDPQEARDWVQGYAAATVAPLYNFGTCQDCPYQGPYPLPPNSIIIPSVNPQDIPWTYDDAWYLSWGVVPSPTPAGPPPGLANLYIYPLPEIYSGVQPTVFPTPYHAKQWSQLSDYGSGRGSRMFFLGVITQFTACTNGQGTPVPIDKDPDGTCYPYFVAGQQDTTRMTNKPSEGWQQMQSLVENYQTPIRWVTDIGWSYNYNSGWRP